MGKKIILSIFFIIFLSVSFNVKAQEFENTPQKEPPVILLTLDKRNNWKLGDPLENKYIWANQILLGSKNYQEASEVVSISWLKSLPENVELKQYFDTAVNSLNNAYSGQFNWKLISEQLDSIMIEVEEPGQHEIHKFMYGPYGIYIVFYTNKNPVFTPKEKKFWINKLKHVHFTGNTITD